MNKMKKRVLAVRDDVKSATFIVSCKAVANDASTLVDLRVIGLDEYSTDQRVIKSLRYAAAVRFFRMVDPLEIVDAMGAAYSGECIAWAVSILWFAFATGNGKEHEEKWNNVFNQWKGKYNHNNKDSALRNELLEMIGVPLAWIEKRPATKAELLVKMDRLNKEEK